ncbi:MAG TPA: transglycosylase domain-containing protein [Solirubrobacterales bacterium]|nr:transglycosylase domain-containing protein [Solirubrobacterales bacterium]
MTQRARRRHRRSRGSIRRKVLVAFGALLGVIVLALAAGGAWVYSIANKVDIDRLKPIHQGSNSVVLAADGSRLGYIQSDTIRRPVKRSEIPKMLDEATVAIEDQNFYEHGGIDPEAILRAAVENVEAGSVVQGGSTITQQLVRNLYITNPQDDIKRKIREAVMADQFESEHSKNWILTKYLNTASYGTTDGRTALGVQAAAETYFDKSVGDLSLPEAAMIAGLPQAPSEYNPLINPKGALQRRNEVLQSMEQQGYINQKDYESALQSGLGLDRGYKYEEIKQPYFFDFVQQQLIDRYGVNTVRNGGLKVYTTINPQLQADAQAAVDSCSVCASDYSLAAALTSVDATNGHILAMASTQDYSASSQFNLAANAHRQPGSSFKPYVLATAMSQGMDPNTTYYSGSSPMDLSTTEWGPWEVNNAGDGEGGTMDVRDATIHSVNVIYAQLDLDVGPDNVKEMAEKLGITSPLDGIPAEGIGGLRIGVTPLEQADAYATFANGGVHHDATAIAKVVFPNDKTDVPDEGEGTRVLSDGIAYEITDILKGVITEGTGAGYTDIGCPAAGKTGTTENESDAWFVGYTPRISTAVWVGHPLSRDYTGYGGPTAGPIWQSYMSAARGSYCGDFPAAENPPEYSSSWSGAHSVSAPSSTSGGTSSGGSGTSYVPPTDTTGNYPSQYYAPGAGADPAPTPSPDTGGDTGGGGPPSGTPAPPSGGPPSGGGPSTGGGTGGTG